MPPSSSGSGGGRLVVARLAICTGLIVTTYLTVATAVLCPGLDAPRPTDCFTHQIVSAAGTRLCRRGGRSGIAATSTWRSGFEWTTTQAPALLPPPCPWTNGGEVSLSPRGDLNSYPPAM
jgi:hypothetical protein